jgi:hypothetical protein
MHEADCILLVCMESHRQRFFGLDQFGIGRDLKWEEKMLQNIRYHEEVNTGFIPVIFATEDEQHIPETVKEASWNVLSKASG